MYINMLTLFTIALLIIAVFSFAYFKHIKKKHLINGLMQEIDRLYRINNFLTSKEVYQVSCYERHILADLKDINKQNGRNYRHIFGKQRAFLYSD